LLEKYLLKIFFKKENVFYIVNSKKNAKSIYYFINEL